MKLNRIFIIGFFLVFAIFFFNFVSATYMRSNVQWSQYNPTPKQEFDQSICQQGQDFIIQISPFGCTPAVVRSDLLEENDVQVYCQLGATKINPLIEVKAIDSISFSGEYPKEVSGIGFHPAKAALGVEGDLNSPILNNIGYAVINLKKQPNASAMPDSVSGTLTARIKYNINKAFGIGNALFHLPQISDDKEWENEKNQYSFWNGKGYLRAEDISNDEAFISIYQNDNKISGVNLKKGETSDTIYLPGFQCQAGLKLKLNDLENPNTRARLRINTDVVEVAKGEKFLDNKCTVTDLNKEGLVQIVSLRCQEDEGINSFNLKISPSVTIKIGDNEPKEYKLGDVLYDGGDKRLFLGYIGETKSGKRFIVPVVSPDAHSERFKQSFIYHQLPRFINVISSYKQGMVVDTFLASYGAYAVVINSIATGSYPVGMFGEGGEKIDTVFDIASAFHIESFSFPYFYDPTVSGDMISTQILATTRVPLTFVSLADPLDVKLSGEAEQYYKKAKDDYETIRESFSSEINKKSGSTFGEDALYNEILLAISAGQKMTASDLCDKFEHDYPDSNRKIEECTALKLSNEELSEIYVTINNQIKKISFDGIYEPSFEDYGATVMVANAGNYSGKKILTKNDRVQVSDTEFFSLVDLKDNSAVFDVSGIDGATSIVSGTIEVKKDDFQIVGSKGYKISLTKINLKKLAKVSVIPNINNAGTQANFSFKIGIEKRAISLSPDRVKEIIKDLDKQIKQWRGISESLGSLVDGLKTSCLLTGVGLVAKNFLFGGFSGIARQEVMRGTGGWYERCADLVKKGTYSSQDQCYNENADKIDSDVDQLSKIIEQQNNDIKQLEQGTTKQEFLGEKIVNTELFAKKYSSQVGNYLNKNFGDAFGDPSGRGEVINKNETLTILSSDYNKGLYTIDQLREIDLYSRILNDPSASSELKEIANATLYSDLLDLKINSQNYIRLKEAESRAAEKGFNGVTFKPYTDETKRKEVYDGFVTPKELGEIPEGESIQGISYNGQEYYVTLEDLGGNAYRIKDVYTLDGIKVSNGDSIKNAYSFFQKYDASSYQNPYKNAKLRYYETEPYKGMPAVVPFDLKNGWYAATKQTLAVGSNIRTYEGSGRVSSFYLCNVGQNGLEEFQTIGDDICEMINTGTGQAYNQFPGLSKSESKTIINKAVQAIEQASRLYKPGLSGKVSILGEKVEVGSPAVNIPEYQCQDFMSPKDCLLLFNLCDPVICPSSRCDLGGAYPVRDVAQSGIIGSLVLCLPNAKEGIVMPVCLTGVRAGINGFLSIMTSYRDCMQENLDTGKMVGICDEIYSLYICDLFWRHAIPLMQIAIPKIAETLAGQNVRGGGEYLGVASAWDTAEKAVDYFVNYYGANSKSSFLARSTEGVGGEICKLYTSTVVPSGGDLLNTLTKPDSPPQFSGRFDEIPLTTATVPPTSHYKVFYHIYAGQDSGAYYQVYLKGNSESSYYQDTSQSYMVASGYVPVGGYATDTPDIVAVSGYKQLCINVNGQEECGFQEVSTSFAVNYIKDEYLASQAGQTDIKSEADCVSDSSNGIIRVCATDNPGKGTDVYTGTNESRWQDVGYCDNEKIRCWIDTNSVENVIKTTTVEGDTLDEISGNYIEKIMNKTDYLNETDFSSKVQEIRDEINPANKISKINEILDKVFWSREKVQLLYLRGNAYAEILKGLIGGIVTKTSSKTRTEVKVGSVGYNIWKVAKDFVYGGWNEFRPAVDDNYCSNKKLSQEKCFITRFDSVCARFISRVMIDAGVTTPALVKSAGKKEGGRFIFDDNSWSTNSESIKCLIKNVFETDDFVEVSPNNLKQGDIVIWGYYCKRIQHITIFDSYDTPNTINTFGEPGLGDINNLRPAELHKPMPIISGGWYVYRAYRYIGDLPDTEKVNAKKNAYTRKERTFNDAVAEAAQYSGQYSDSTKNAVFVNQLVADGLLTESECAEVSGIRFNSDGYQINPYDVDSRKQNKKSMSYLNTLLRTKLNAGQKPEQIICGSKKDYSLNQPLDISGERIKKETVGDKVWKVAASEGFLNHSYDSPVEFVSSSLKSAGVGGLEKIKVMGGVAVSVAPSSLDELVSVIEKDKDFKEVDIKSLKSGDIVLIGKECNKDYSVGIVDSQMTNNQVWFYTVSNGVVDMSSIDLISEIGVSGQYIYRAYRYIGDLSESEKVLIKSRNRWTVNSAIEELTNKKGSYDKNKQFVDQLVFDGVLNEEECKDMRGINSWAGTLGGAFLQKDMKYLKNNILLPKKLSSAVSGSAH